MYYREGNQHNKTGIIRTNYDFFTRKYIEQSSLALRVVFATN